MGRFLREEYRRIMDLYPASWWGDRLDVRFELLRRMSGTGAGRTLDMGCAEGVILHRAKGGPGVGVDLRADFLARSREVSPGTLHVRADYRALPFKEGSFRRALLGHIVGTENLGDLLDQAAHVLAPGGRIYITSPNPGYFAYRGSTCPDLDLVLKELEKRGFFIVEAAGYNPIVFFFFGRGGGIISLIPGVEAFLGRLMRLPWPRVRRLCVSYLVVAEKKTPGTSR